MTGETGRLHHVETYIEGDAFGWQCFEPSCRMEATGFEDFDAADMAADRHSGTPSPTDGAP